jgi:hypothetical protein
MWFKPCRSPRGDDDPEPYTWGSPNVEPPSGRDDDRQLSLFTAPAARPEPSGECKGDEEA